MATPSSGAISLYDVLIEQGLNGTISLNDAVCRNYAGAPSGQISMSQLRGKSKLALWVASNTKGYGRRFITLGLSGVGGVSSHGWVSNPNGISATQTSATSFTFGNASTAVNKTGTYRFTVTRGTESLSIDVGVSVPKTGSK